MALKFNGAWRFNPPEDGRFVNRTIPWSLLEELAAMINRIATQGIRQDVLEHFKRHFCTAVGTTNVRSSNESWAETDLRSRMDDAANNAPLFLEAFFDACEELRKRHPNWFVPDQDLINPVLGKYNLGYVINPPHLVCREQETPPVETVC